MIKFDRFQLKNGLRVIVHSDTSTPMVAVNLLYDVGSRDESPEKTGFAHLFEHLMFGGSQHVDNFDDYIQLAGGESNAFTNNDITNYYDTLPAQNVETAFWLESDRMSSLSVNKKGLEIQQKVVIEEFKETCLNQPYGDVWHHLSELAYKVHPYRWPVIGKNFEHVAEATLADVTSFYRRFYTPNNSILTVCGNITTKEVKYLAEKWFGDIPAGPDNTRNLPIEPRQTQLQQRFLNVEVPMDALYFAFHINGRTHPDFYTTDLLTDILCNGESSRLYKSLLKEQKLFVDIDCYSTGTNDPSLIVIEGKPAEGVSLEQAKAAIWNELEALKATIISERELQKWKNKVESNLVFSELSALHKAMNLAFFESLGNPNLINEEVLFYQQVNIEDIHRLANETFTPSNCSELFYVAPK